MGNGHIFIALLTLIWENGYTAVLLLDIESLKKHGKTGIPNEVIKAFKDKLFLVLDFSNIRSVKDFTFDEDEISFTVGFDSVPTAVSIPLWVIEQIIIPNHDTNEPKTNPGLSIVGEC